MTIDILTVTQDQIKKVISKGEGHFIDLKGKHILPARLTKSLSAFANADGGELLIGFDEPQKARFVWNGFDRIEDANGHVQTLEEFFPLGTHFRYYFWKAPSQHGFILHCEIDKTGTSAMRQMVSRICAAGRKACHRIRPISLRGYGTAKVSTAMKIRSQRLP